MATVWHTNTEGGSGNIKNNRRSRITVIFSFNSHSRAQSSAHRQVVTLLHVEASPPSLLQPSWGLWSSNLLAMSEVCQICGDAVGLTATGDVFVACHECAFPLCHRCFEYEWKNGNQSCPQCKARYKSHKGSPCAKGDDDDDDLDDLENEVNYDQGNNTNAGLQWEEDADFSSSSGHDSQIPNPLTANGQPMSGEIPCATPDTQSVQATSSSLSPSKMVHSLPYIDPKQPGLESDEEIRRVPEIGGESAGTSGSRPGAGSTAGQERAHGTGDGQRKRGRSPADKESKRLKRLLRNRVSAQQARERKKAYLIDLETKVKDLEKKNSEFKEKLYTLQNENQMLRQILKNTTASRRGSNSGTNAE